MTARLTIDGAGRVVIPKPLRKELDLSPGDTLELEAKGYGWLEETVESGAATPAFGAGSSQVTGAVHT